MKSNNNLFTSFYQQGWISEEDIWWISSLSTKVQRSFIETFYKLFKKLRDVQRQKRYVLILPHENISNSLTLKLLLSRTTLLASSEGEEFT